MEEAMREQVRAFAARGLESLEQEDLPDARGNLVLTCEALRDRKGAETCCSREEMEALDRVLRELEAFPKLAANSGGFPAGSGRGPVLWSRPVPDLLPVQFQLRSGHGDPAGPGPSGMERADPGREKIPLKVSRKIHIYNWRKIALYDIIIVHEVCKSRII